ncbi:hypothetical protein [Kitasatospora sp. NPDC058046]|uniref:hypothetical protein n=1 Tax=Kitasatospora sp. NPDC058046 TaxID=3346312 RepID=UPI0036DF8831
MTGAATPDLTATDFDLDDLLTHAAHLLGPAWGRSMPGDTQPAVWQHDGLVVEFDGIPGDDPDEDVLVLASATGDDYARRTLCPEEDETLAGFGERVAAAVREVCAELGPSPLGPGHGQSALF